MTAVLVVGVAAILVWFYNSVSIPKEANADALARTTVVYYDDGQTEMGRFAQHDRTVLASQDIPDHVKKMFVAAEDRSFYDNSGISIPGIVRAALSNYRAGGEVKQGGSTITQQYVKLLYLTQERTVSRKAKEAVLAIKVDREKSKDEILTGYLNTIYLGRGANGIQAAAKAYFDKDAKDLTMSEAAMLAGITPSATYWDPANNLDMATSRWRYTLSSAVEAGFITNAEKSAMQFPVLPKVEQDQSFAGPQGYLLQAVRDELLAKEQLKSLIDTGGLKITSTISKKMQDDAVAAMNNERAYPAKDRPEGMQAALVTIDSPTGEIRAMYGGPDYLARQQNAATQDVAQAGSTFKPFGLIAALEKGIGLNSTVNGNDKQRFKEMYRDGKPNAQVVNFSSKAWGHVNLRTATANSINTAYVAINEKVGPAATRDVAIRLGVPEGAQDLTEGLGNVLGYTAVHPLDMAQAYSTISNKGVRNDAHIVREVLDPSGKRLYTPDPKQRRVVEEDVIADATYAMEGVVRSGSGAAAAISGRDIAGKTGTSSNNKSAWFVGFTPQLTTAVAMFNSGPAGEQLPLPRGFGGRSEVTGGSFPAKIWRAYMVKALDGVEDVDFPKPAWVGKTQYLSGKPTPTTTSPTTTKPTPTASTTGTPKPTKTTPTGKPKPTQTKPTDKPKPTPSWPQPTVTWPQPTNTVQPTVPQPTLPTPTVPQPTLPIVPTPPGP